MLAASQPDKSLQKSLRRTGVCLLAFILILIIYCGWLQFVRHNELAGSSLNRFNNISSERGRIISADGVVLAETNNKNQRIYPLGAAAAPVTGYDSIRYGKSGTEAVDNKFLTGSDNAWRDLGPLGIFWGVQRGDDIKLSIDSSLQKYAYNLLAGYRGAVVMLDIKSGAIVAMVSRPTYNPNTIDDDWDELNASDDGNLLNRASQGLYPPGSTGKIITLEAALADGVVDANSMFNDTGELKIGKDYILHNDEGEVFGQLSLEKALAVSCNTVFGSIGLRLGGKNLADVYERFGFDKELDIGVGDNIPTLPPFTHLGDGDLAQTAIGQGSLLVTPLRMAMVTQAIANQGAMMKPYLTYEEISAIGDVVWQVKPEKWLQASQPGIADTVSDMMRAVVKYGTAYAINSSTVPIAGKTGTAQNPHGKPHSWFVGFAPADKPQIAIAVVVENAGYAAEYAVPIAGKLLNQAVR